MPEIIFVYDLRKIKENSLRQNKCSVLVIFSPEEIETKTFKLLKILNPIVLITNMNNLKKYEKAFKNVYFIFPQDAGAIELVFEEEGIFIKSFLLGEILKVTDKGRVIVNAKRL